MAEKLEPYCGYLVFYKQLGLEEYMQSQIVINVVVLFQAATIKDFFWKSHSVPREMPPTLSSCGYLQVVVILFL